MKPAPIPVIFASSLLYLPQLIVQLTKSADGTESSWQSWVSRYLADPSSWVYILVYFAMTSSSRTSTSP